MIDIRVPPRVVPPAKPGRHLVEQFVVLRGKSGLTTRQQAAVSGVSMSTTHAWKTGENGPSLHAFVRALAALGYELTITRKSS